MLEEFNKKTIMAETEMLRELELASQILMAPPNVVTKEQRQTAEQMFMNFRKAKTPYNLCRHILETTTVDYVLFEAACVLREALVREWSFLQESDIISLRQYLFQYILNRTNLAPFVRERLLQVIAIMVKRGSVNDMGQERSRIVSEVENLIVSGDAARQTLGCNIISAIMQEYASTIKSCDAGLTWDTHFKVKKQFEMSDLKRIFRFCVRALGELIKVEEANAQTIGLLRHLLSITSGVLCWGFISATLPKRLIGMFETVYDADNSPPLRLGPMWKDVILDEAVTSLFFQVHWKVRDDQELSHYSLVCLAQLAKLSGAVIADKELQVQYITGYLTNFIKFINSVEVLPWEALGIAQLLRKMLQHFSCSMLVTINGGELFTQFVHQLTRLTSRFAEGAAQEESVCAEDRRYMEAFDHLLEAWVSVLQSSHLYPRDFCSQPAIDIFNTYLRCHLAPPDGSRGQILSFQDGEDHGEHGQQEEQEIYESEEPDRVRFREQLIIIGLIGRQVPGHSLQIVARLLEERTLRLRNQLQKVAAQNYSISDSSVTISLFEDLHWLLLIAGHLIALESEGETALISDDIMRHSVLQAATVDTAATLRLLTTPGFTPEQLGVPESSLDDTVRVISAVMRLCEVETQALEAQMTGVMSPELGSTLVWFLAHWSTSFLLPSESLYGEMSPVMSAAFSSNETGIPIWLANQLLSKVEANLRLCPGEHTLARDSASLLISLVDKQEKAAKLCRCSGLATVIRFLHSAVRCQPARRELAKGVILAAAGHTPLEAKKEYIKQVVQPFVDRFVVIISRENFKDVCHQEDLKLELTDFLELFVGISQGATSSSAQPLFDILRPVISQLAPLLGVYKNYPQLVELCLELLLEITKRMLWCLDEVGKDFYLSKCQLLLESYGKHVVSCDTVYKNCLGAVQCYSLDHTGRRSVSQCATEEDVFRDLVLVMEILTGLLSKDLADYKSSNSDDTVSSVDVCLFGLRTIMPLMTPDLLKFPVLCQQYYKMISYAAEIYPERVSRLPEDQLANLVASVHGGLTSFGPDISSLSCDFIFVLCQHIFPAESDDRCRNMMHPFLKILLDMILSGQFNSDSMISASKALFALICCFKDTYQHLVGNILNSYPDPAVRERLTSAFNDLTSNLNLTPQLQNVRKFRDNFEKFVSNVYGFLLVR